MKNLVSSFLLVFSLLFSATTFAMASKPSMTKNEWRLLPSFCMYVQGAPGHGTENQRRLFSADQSWTHVHHYCWAIVQTMRSYRHLTDRSVANDYMRTAIGNLDYTLNNVSPGFLLRPDMLVRKATLQIRLQNLAAAAETARQLISERPELPEGYITLANIQLMAGLREQADQTLKIGGEKVENKEKFETMKQTLSGNRR